MNIQEKEKKEKIILIVTVVVFSLFSIRFILTNAAGKKPYRPPGSAHAFGITGKPGPGPAAPQAEAAVRIAEEFVPEAAEEGPDAILKNPFEAPVDLMNKMKSAMAQGAGEEEAGDLPNVNMQGVVWGGDSPFVFVNDKIYRKGDMINDAQILDIDKNGAYFLYNGRRVLVKPKNKI